MKTTIKTLLATFIFAQFAFATATIPELPIEGGTILACDKCK